MERIELSLHAANDLVNPIEVMHARWSPSFLEELNRKGGGTFRVRVEDELWDDSRLPFQKGRVCRVKVGGQIVGYWELQKDSRKIIDGMEANNHYVEFSGVSIRDWLSHAVILPEQGLAQISGDDRFFNYSSSPGAWYIPSQWVSAVSHGKVLTEESYWFRSRQAPAGWPKAVSAWWIGDRPWAQVMPPGDLYFRRTFSTTSAGKYRILTTADDRSVVMLNGVRVMKTSHWPSTWESDFDLPAGNHVLAVRVWNAGQVGPDNPVGFVMAVCRLGGDGGTMTEDLTDNDVILQTEATSGLWKVNAYPSRPPGFTVGGIILQFLKEAKDRGVHRLQQISTDFTHIVDSYGQPWPTTIDPTFRIGDTLAEVVQQISDSYADVWMDGLVLRCAPQRGVDRSVPIGVKDGIRFEKGRNVLDAGTEANAEISNTVFTKTSSKYIETAGPADSISQYGRRETYLSAVNASEDGTAPFLIKQLLDKFAHERRTPTLQIFPDDGNIPWRDFGVGDWVLAPSDDGRGMIRRRIVSIAAKESAQGDLEYTCEIDTIQDTLEERISRWLTELADGNKQGGISGTSRGTGSAADISMGGDQDGGIVSVVITPVSPEPPGALALNPDVYVEGGRTTGKLLASWTHSGLAVDGSDQDARLFELYARLKGSGVFKIIGSTPNLSVEVAPLPAVTTAGVALVYEAYVVAVSDEGLMSQPSTIVEVTMTKDTTPPLQPSKPTVIGVRGVFTVFWDGKDLNNSAMAADTRYAIVDERVGTAAWVARGNIAILSNGNPNSLTIADLPYGTHEFRLRAVDYSNNLSVPSAAATATTAPLVGDSEFTSAFEKINADIAIAGSGANLAADVIGVRELAVMDFTNYAPGGNFDYTRDMRDWNFTGSRVTVVAAGVTAPFAGAGCLQVAAGTGVQIMERKSPIPVTEGERWKFEYRVKMTAAWNGTTANSKLRVVDQAGASKTSPPHGPVSTAWVLRTFDYVIPAGMTTLTPALMFDHTAGIIRVDQLRIRRMDAGELLVDGVVKARQIDVTNFFADNGVVGKLTAQMAVFLTNEDGTGAKSTVTGQGVRVTYTDPATGEVQERARFGTFGNDYVSLSGDDGQVVSSLDKQGNVTGKNIVANDSLWYRGDELQRVIDRGPRGVISGALRETHSVNNAWANGPSQPCLRLDVVLEPGRLYKIWTSPIRVGVESNNVLRVVYGWKWDSPATVYNRNILSYSDVDREGQSAVLQELFANLGKAPRFCSFIIDFAIADGIGQGGLRGSPQTPVRLVVEDVGPQRSDTVNFGVHQDGPYFQTNPPLHTTPDARRSYTLEVNRNNVRSYTGAGAVYNFNQGKGYQGPSPAGYGNLNSIWIFPDVTGPLAGSVIMEVWAYFYFEHWFENSGGYARIGVHGHGSVPGSFSSGGAHQGSENWPKGAGRWVKLPENLYIGFQNGSIRGLTLEGDGSQRTYGIATDASLKFVYVK